ncbi:hypothetical protein ACEQ8H_003265 [Pleosporales sp. CAS-2024a]
MVSVSRLDRLATLIQADLAALPDRPTEPELAIMPEDDDLGGVALEDADALPAASIQQRIPHGPTESAPATALTKSPGRPMGSGTLPATGLRRGDLADGSFMSILALSRYPYKYCSKAHMQNIASAFFDAGKFWQRPWDLFYLHDVEPAAPMILVQEAQVQNLLDEINNHLQLELHITNSQRQEGLVVQFPDHPACRPRYLGRTYTREQYDAMASSVPDRYCGPGPDNGTLEDFKQVMEDLRESQRKKEAKQAKKQLQRLAKQTSMVDQLKRAQRYLGLRSAHPEGVATSSTLARPVDTSQLTPFAFVQSVVFICVDVESYERAHHKITEIGIATLDTRDLRGIAPGADGQAWRKMIKARHFRIKEHCHLINHKFVSGHPDRFEFGESTFIGLDEAATHIAACLKPPFAAHASNTDEEELVHVALGKLDLDENRNLVFLGHDTRTDVRYLQQLGYDPMKVENIIEAMDTAKIYQAWRLDPQPASLGRILNDFDVAAWNLHNAGNDAVYTVQALLAVCVREASIRGTTELEAKPDKDQAARLAAARGAAVRQAEKDVEDSW